MGSAHLEKQCARAGSPPGSGRALGLHLRFRRSPAFRPVASFRFALPVNLTRKTFSRCFPCGKKRCRSENRRISFFTRSQHRPRNPSPQQPEQGGVTGHSPVSCSKRSARNAKITPSKSIPPLHHPNFQDRNTAPEIHHLSSPNRGASRGTALCHAVSEAHGMPKESLQNHSPLSNHPNFQDRNTGTKTASSPIKKDRTKKILPFPTLSLSATQTIDTVFRQRHIQGR